MTLGTGLRRHDGWFWILEGLFRQSLTGCPSCEGITLEKTLFLSANHTKWSYDDVLGMAELVIEQLHTDIPNDLWRDGMKKLQRAVVLCLILSLLACDGPKLISTKTTDEDVLVESPRFERVSIDPVEHGQRLSAVLGCLGCHTPDYTGEDWSDPELGVLWTANLTHSAAEFTHHELAVMITEGRRPDRSLLDMPSYLFSQLHPDDLSALISYFKSLPITGVKHPDPTIGPQLKADMESGKFKDSAQTVKAMEQLAPPDLGEEHEQARFMLRATCAECHGMDLAGSSEGLMDAPPRPGLTMVAAYSEQDFFTLMRTGKALGDRDLKLMSGVARWRYSKLTDTEIKAIYAYLIRLANQPLD